jgi:hypothetical protein
MKPTSPCPTTPSVTQQVESFKPIVVPDGDKLCPILSRSLVGRENTRLHVVCCVREKCQAWVSKKTSDRNVYHLKDCPSMWPGEQYTCTCPKDYDFGYCRMMEAK